MKSYRRVLLLLGSLLVSTGAASQPLPDDVIDPEIFRDRDFDEIVERFRRVPSYSEFEVLYSELDRLLGSSRVEEAVERCEEALSTYSGSPSTHFLCSPVLLIEGDVDAMRVYIDPQELTYRETAIALTRFNALERQLLAFGVPIDQIRRLERTLRVANSLASDHDLTREHAEVLDTVYTDIGNEIASSLGISQSAAQQLLAAGVLASLKQLREYCGETNELAHMHAIFDAPRSTFDSQLQEISFGPEDGGTLCDRVTSSPSGSDRIGSEGGTSFRQCMEDLAYEDPCMGGPAASGPDGEDGEEVSDETESVDVGSDTSGAEDEDEPAGPHIDIKVGGDAPEEGDTADEVVELLLELELGPGTTDAEVDLDGVDWGSFISAAGGFVSGITGLATSPSPLAKVGGAAGLIGGLAGMYTAADADVSFDSGPFLCPSTQIGPVSARFRVSSGGDFDPSPGRIPFRRAMEYCACEAYGDETPEAPALGLSRTCGDDDLTTAFDCARADSDPSPPGFTPPDPEHCTSIGARDNVGTLGRVFEAICERIQCPGQAFGAAELGTAGAPFCNCILPGGAGGGSGGQCGFFDCLDGGVAVWKNEQCVCEETSPPIGPGSIILIPGQDAARDRVILKGLSESMLDSMRQRLGNQVLESNSADLQ